MLNKFNSVDFHVHGVKNNNQTELKINFPDPFISSILCPGHITRCVDVSNQVYTYMCETCKKIVYKGSDPFIYENAELLNCCNDDEIIFPMLTASSEIQHQIDYYERLYPNEIIGYKIHPNFSTYDVSNLKITSKKILIFHSGKGIYEDPNKIISFAKNYCGDVIIAHLGRLNEDAFRKTRKLKNVFFDCSSISLIWKDFNERQNKLFDLNFLGECKSADTLLLKIIKYVGRKKILYGSDLPYGDKKNDIQIINQLPKHIKKLITKTNPINLLKKHI